MEDSGSDVADSEDEAFIDDTATPEPPVHVLTPRKKAAVAAAKKAQERKAPALLQPRPRQPPPALEQDESEEGDDLLSPSPEDEEEYEETEEELEVMHPPTCPTDWAKVVRHTVHLLLLPHLRSTLRPWEIRACFSCAHQSRTRF